METRVKVKEIMKQLDATFVERTDAIACVWLALLTRQNFILVGDPGTAKTAVVHACYSHVAAARTFAMLCGSFATEDKVFGPYDIKAYQGGPKQRSIVVRLADCELAFLDEMLKSNEGTLNGMLTALNERTYDGKAIPLRTCGAATNWPEVRARGDNVAALWDRVLIRCEVKDITEEAKRIKMLEAVDKVAKYKPVLTITMKELDQAFAEIQTVEVSEVVRRNMVKIQKSLEAQKPAITASSRRYGALQQVLRALAWLDGRDTVLIDDFDALAFGLWSDRDHIAPVRAVVDAVDHEVVAESLSKLREAIGQCEGNTRPDQVPKLLQMAAEAATNARKQLEKQGARQKGKAQIKGEIERLKAVYGKLRGKVSANVAAPAGEDV